MFLFIKVMELYLPPFYYLPEGPFQPNPLFNDPISVLKFSTFFLHFQKNLGFV